VGLKEELTFTGNPRVRKREKECLKVKEGQENDPFTARNIDFGSAQENQIGKFAALGRKQRGRPAALGE